MLDISLWNVFRKLGIPPRAWMRPNPFKVYEFYEVVRPSGLRPEHSVIDLGSGRGYFTMLLAEKCHHITGIEPSQDAVNYAQRFLKWNRRDNIRFLPTVLESADLPRKTFDRIYSFCVLEHIENLDTVLAEAFALLRPGGEMHVSVDSLQNIMPELRSTHKADHFVYQYFTLSSLRLLFERSGFEVLDIYPIMTGPLAAQEFENRIYGNYKYHLLKRLLTYYRIRRHDKLGISEAGVMLIGRVRRPREH